MTRAEAIAIIEQSIPTADDATLEAAARLLHAGTGDADLPRDLTDAELASLEEARADFAAGRTYTSAEVRAYLAERREQRAGRAKV